MAAALMRTAAVQLRFLQVCGAPKFSNILQRRWSSSGAGRPESDQGSAPLPFSGSRAATWRARDTFGGGAEDDDIPRYQMPAVLVSVFSLLIYFCMLREENDIDAQLGVSVLEKVPGLERKSLEAFVAHQEAAGVGVDRERARLDELRRRDTPRQMSGPRKQTEGRPPAVSQSAASLPWLSQSSARYLTGNQSAAVIFRARPHARYCSSGGSGRRPRHPWDFKLSPLTSQLILTGSLTLFMLYFFLLREESDVDTDIYRPIWERIPDVSPEMAEKMLAQDKALGIFYDNTWEKSLVEYKKRYYAKHPELVPPPATYQPR